MNHQESLSQGLGLAAHWRATTKSVKSKTAMRVLFVSDRPPWPLTEGTRQRHFYLLKALTECAEVTLVAPSDSAELAILRNGFPLRDACTPTIHVDPPPPALDSP